MLGVGNFLPIDPERFCQSDKIGGFGNVDPWILDTPKLHALAVRIQAVVIVNDDDYFNLLFRQRR